MKRERIGLLLYYRTLHVSRPYRSANDVATDFGAGVGFVFACTLTTALSRRIAAWLVNRLTDGTCGCS